MTFLLDLATQTILLSLFLFFTACRRRKATWWRTGVCSLKTMSNYCIHKTKTKTYKYAWRWVGIFIEPRYLRNIDFGCNVKKPEEESLLLDWKKSILHLCEWEYYIYPVTILASQAKYNRQYKHIYSRCFSGSRFLQRSSHSSTTVEDLRIPRSSQGNMIDNDGVHAGGWSSPPLHYPGSLNCSN